MSLSWSMHANTLICFFVVGSDSFLTFDSINIHLEIRQYWGCSISNWNVSQGQSCAPPLTFVKSSILAGASLKSHLKQDKLSSMFHLAALHRSLKSSCGICIQQLSKLNTVFPVSFSTLSCITSYNPVKIMSIHK